MKPVVVVVALTSSFEQMWPGLIESAGCELRMVSERDISRIGAVSQIIVSAGGAEVTSPATIARLLDGNRHAPPPIAVVGGISDHRIVIQLLQGGANDYFALPGDLGALRSWMVERADAVRRTAERLSVTRDEQARFDYSQLIGRSQALKHALDLTTRVTPHREAAVLVTGETGTGKELIARAIHYNGANPAQPFVEINCSAIPGALLEAELFGYEPGAFTDARTAKPGLFELAQSGTVFLDEIGEMPIELQAKILRVLEEKRVRRLGGTESKDIHARIIAATHVDLAAAVRAQRFREDLYYRLNVFRIHLPPLRERREDIELLAEHFLAHFAARYNVPTPELSQRLHTTLFNHSWPGNVRELRNAIERSMLLGPDEALLPDGATPPPQMPPSPIPFPTDLVTMQCAAAVAMLAHHRGNKSAAAEALGVSRKRLYALLAAHSSTSANPDHRKAKPPSGESER